MSNWWGRNELVKRGVPLRARVGLVREHDPCRKSALAAITTKNVAWVRNHKASIYNLSGWAHRRRLTVRTVLAAEATSYFELFFFGRFFRLVLAKSFNCFSLIDSAICFDAPLREDFFLSPRFAASAAPAAICCFFDFAGIFNHRSRSRRRVCRSCVQACSTKSRHWTIASYSTTCQFTLRTSE